MNTAQYKDERGLYNMTQEQVESAEYHELNAICCSCNAQGGWTIGTKSLVIKELARRSREIIEARELKYKQA